MNPHDTNFFGTSTLGPNLFGTDGIRGTAGQGLFVEEKLIAIGKALGRWACERYGDAPHILLIHDTRISADDVKTALMRGLLTAPIGVYDGQVLPTPAAAHLMRQATPKFSAAIIISASHNPYQDNGIKIIDAASGKLALADELRISELSYEELARKQITTAQLVGHKQLFTEAAARYCAAICQLFPANFLQGKKIVLDTAHGATYQVAPEIFTKLGANVITINHTPNGYNINEKCGALHLEQLQAAVIQETADIGFAFDGDGDRLMTVTANGTIKDGDDVLALLSNHPTYATTKHIVGTIMSNEGLANYLAQRGKTLLRTPVGDKYIAERLATDNLLLGGEPSGHSIVRDLVATGDGILVALKVLETIALTDNKNFETFTKYPQLTTNLIVTTKEDLTREPFAGYIRTVKNGLSSGRIEVRYSGTEPVLRIMAEADTVEHAQAACQQLAYYFSHHA